MPVGRPASRMLRRIVVLLLVLLTGLPAVAAAQARARRTVRATRAPAPLRIDGSLDESFYRDVEPQSDFVQIEPQDGAPATQKTEMWIGFDRENVYVTFRCWESSMDRVVAKEMRRDNTAIWGGDDIVVLYLDTFNDGRNGFQFVMNAIGGRTEGQATNDGSYNGDWNTVWNLATGRFDGGWIVETAIPFKSLRYAPGADQVWGINAVRANRWKNELSFFNHVPKERGQAGVHYSSVSGLVEGIMAPSGSRNLELKPYVISNATGQTVPGDGTRNDISGDLGLDLKYGLSQNLTADVTYNTDFAQVEADQQQVNLTRFSLFFPEKRDFFLENQGMFTFGGVSQTTAGTAPILFYSRRIGLERGLAVPIRAGGRVTGRLGRYSVGALNIQTGDEPAATAQAANFSVVRLRRDILRRSSVGLLLTARNGAGAAPQDSAAYGLDGTFGFFRNLNINTYWARTEDQVRRPSTARGNRDSYRGQIDYTGDRYGVQLERLSVGDAFNPGVGYVRRLDMSRSYGEVRFSPRPRRSRVVRKYSWTGSLDYVENGAGRLETRVQDGEFLIDFQNADRFTAGYTDTHEFLPAPFRIARSVTLPVGGYDFSGWRLGYNRANRRRIAGNVLAERGTFYNGTRTALAISSGRLSLTPRFSLEPTYTVNRVALDQGRFTSQLIGSRVTFTATPFMFTSALVQFNSDSRALSTNVRLRWEYRPGSELFIVYNDERNTTGRAFPDLMNRAFIIKINRLFRF